MTEKDKRYIENAMTGKVTYGVLKSILNRINDMLKKAVMGAFNRGYEKGHTDGMKMGKMRYQWSY